MNCEICIEKCDGKEITCDSCKYITCKSCYKHYLFESGKKAHCMNCKINWPRKFLAEKFPNKFLNDEYKKYCENLIYENEKKLFPQTQIIITRNNKKEEIKNLKKEYKEKMLLLENELKNLNFNTYFSDSTEEFEYDKNIIFQNCSKQDCNGFINNIGYCSLCNSYTCKKCLELIEDKIDHMCNKDKIETLKLIEKETKPCPKCFIRINKISNTCHQMFCTNCKTIFDWKTGLQVLSGPMHNPHYLDWRRDQRINGIDEICVTNLMDRLIFFEVIGYINIGLVEKYRLIVHLDAHDKHRFTNNVNNEELRISFLSHKIDEDKFKVLLQQREKRTEKNHEIFTILSQFSTKATDAFLIFVSSIDIKKEYNKTELQQKIKDLEETLEEIRQKTNKDLSYIGDVFKSKKHQNINQDFHLLNF